jgi:NDP-sugar pyrophosphorylase family protein
MNIIIPLGGKGERFKKEGYDKPKPLIKVLDKEILFHVIDNLLYSEIGQDIKINIYIIYNKALEESNFSNIIKENYPDIKLIELEHDTKGATETVYIGICNILNEFENRFNDNDNNNTNTLYKKTLLIDGDTFYTKNIIEMFYNEINENLKEIDGAIFYLKNYDTKPLFSYIDIDKDSIVKEIIEKVKISDNANTGAYGFANIYQLQKYAKYVLDNNITFKNECYTSCIIDTMIKDGNRFIGIELDDKDVHVLGTPEQVRDFEKNYEKTQLKTS